MADVKPVLPGTHTVTPHLVVDDAAAAIEWYGKAFGARERLRMTVPGGSKIIHAEVEIGDSRVMLVDAFPEWGSMSPKSLNGTPVTIHLSVPDVDKVFATAIAAGGTVAMPLADMFWGDRYGQITDPFGHKWSMATHIADLSPAEMKAALEKAFSRQP